MLMILDRSYAEILGLALRHESRILRQWSNLYLVQGRAKPVLSWKNHIQGWMYVRESYSRALEQGTLILCRKTQKDNCRTAILVGDSAVYFSIEADNFY